jgi:hypothetical protein
MNRRTFIELLAMAAAVTAGRPQDACDAALRKRRRRRRRHHGHHHRRRRRRHALVGVRVPIGKLIP